MMKWFAGAVAALAFGTIATAEDLKLAVIPGVVRGKRVIVVDDSLVRGTTSKRRIQALRDAGATEIHMRVSCPPTSHPCYFGIDFPSREELLASSRSVQEVCEFIGADSLGYMSLEGLLSAVEQPGDYCTGCFSGHYPMQLTDAPSKRMLESGQLQSV